MIDPNDFVVQIKKQGFPKMECLDCGSRDVFYEKCDPDVPDSLILVCGDCCCEMGVTRKSR